MIAPNPNQIEAMLMPTGLDRAIGAVFPGWAASRLRARREYAYEAARSTRLRPSARQLAGPEDYSAFPDRLQLIREMRELVQNFGLLQSIQDKLAIYAFGRLQYQARTGDENQNRAQEEYIKERFRSIDYSGRYNLRQLVCIAYKSQQNDGDFGLQWKRRDGYLRLAGVESDRIGGQAMQSALDTYFQGINVHAESGVPLTYDVYRRTKGNAFVDMVQVPAADMILLLDGRRIDQYRGITPFAPVINEMKDLKEVLVACLAGTKFENYHAALAYTENGQMLNDPSSYLNGTDANSNGVALSEQQIKPGLIQGVPKNGKLEFIKSERPSGQFQTYLETLIRLIGTARNLPFGFLYNLSGLGGPAARMDAQQAHRVIQWDQQNMVDLVLDRVKNTILMEGMGNGEVPYHPNWKRGEWQFPPAISIDVGRDSNAAISEVAAGMRSKANWFLELGQDDEEQEQVIAAEAERTLTRAQEIAKKTGVSVELALTLLDMRTPNGYVQNTGAPEAEEPVEKTEETGSDPKEMALVRTNEALVKLLDHRKESAAITPEVIAEEAPVPVSNPAIYAAGKRAAVRVKDKLNAINRFSATVEAHAARKERNKANDPLKEFLS